MKLFLCVKELNVQINPSLYYWLVIITFNTRLLLFNVEIYQS